MKEIERKYLVDPILWKQIQKPDPQLIAQGYLLNSKEATVRVRIKGSKAFLTIKGAQSGISRSEFEYEIPVHDAKEIMHQFVEKPLIKERYEIKHQNHIWEIDDFQGKLKGLLMAEIELSDESELFDLPPWVTVEVSHDPNYLNANLIRQL